MSKAVEPESHLDRQRREDLTFLTDQGETFENAAKRLGLSLVALDQWLQRNDKPLRARLKANGRTGRVRRGRVLH